MKTEIEIKKEIDRCEEVASRPYESTTIKLIAIAKNANTKTLLLQR